MDNDGIDVGSKILEEVSSEAILNQIKRHRQSSDNHAIVKRILE